MKPIINKLYTHRHFLLFILLFAYIQSIYSRISIRQHITLYTFTPEAALATVTGAGILFFVIRFFIKSWSPANGFSYPILFKIFGSSLLAYVVLMQLIGLAMAFSFGKMDKNFNQHTITISLLSDFLNGVIYGSFFLAYYYYNKSKAHQLKLSTYNKALAESKINQLKTQLNPHFLFNNLNILDQLIEEDKRKASDFLNEFADIYRYVLQSSDKELASISDEVDFAKQYFKLVQEKYGTAYQLHIDSKNDTDLMVPLTLQLLIENAIQHNLGKPEKPIIITIVIDKSIYVSNNVHLKRHTKPTSGRALKNLSEQYQLLSEQSTTVLKTEEIFSVTIPLIRKPQS